MLYPFVANSNAAFFHFRLNQHRDGLVVSPDSRSLAAITQGGSPLTSVPGNHSNHVCIFDVATGQQLQAIPFRSGRSVAFSPDGGLLAISTSALNSKTVLFDTRTGKELARPAVPWFASCLAFAPNGKTLVVGDVNGCITLWDASSGPQVDPAPEPAASMHELHFVDKGKQLVARTRGDGLYWWDVRSGQVVRKVRLKRQPDISPHYQVISPDEKLVAALSNRQLADKSVKTDIVLIDVGTGQTVQTLIDPTKEGFAYTAFSPDGTKLFVAGGNAPVSIWDVTTGKLLHELRGHTGRVQGVTTSADGQWLASWAIGSDGNRDCDIILWDVVTAKLVHRLTARRGAAFMVVFSADSSRLVSVGGDPHRGDAVGEVELWDVATGKVLRTFAGHEDRVLWVAMTPDSRMLATASLDKTLRLWEVASGAERQRIIGHESRVYALDFSPDGRLLAAASDDAPVYIWDVYGQQKARVAPEKLSSEGEQNLWQQLASTDAAEGFRAVCELVARTNDAVAVLKDGWNNLPRATTKRMQDLIADLDSDQFALRKNAGAELERFATGHEDLLRKASEQAVALEVRQRLEQIISHLEPQRLRRTRMIEVLERIGNDSARQFLRQLAELSGDAEVSREAAASLKRVEGR